MIASVGPRQMPYPGLRPFEAEDAPLFFGREAQVGSLLRQLEDHRFAAVVGSSGSGKSSLVRAGLLPAVHEGFLLGTTEWRVLLMKPGHQPYQGLARALNEGTRPHGDTPVALAGEATSTPREARTLAALRSTDRGLLLALADTSIGPDCKVMVVVDQFEELFAFRRTGARREDVISRDEAAGFVKLLLRACSDPEGRVWVVLTMRSDFIGDCEAFLGLPEAVSRSQFLVPRLDRSQMEEAIARPGEVRDASFQAFTFEEGLVNSIINDAGDRPDQLPLMQHALMRTWKLAVRRAGTDGAGMKLDDYDEAGGIGSAISLHADEAWKKIEGDPKKARIARQLAELAAKMQPKEAAAVAGRGAQRLVRLLEDPKETDADHLAARGQVLGTLSLAIRSARQTQLLALSHMLLRQVPSQDDDSEDTGNEREVVIRLCKLLAPQDLAEVLKWPFAVGEAETIILASLEKKTGKQFAGDVWKFVEQAEALGIKDIGLPAKRPRVEDALKELEELRDGTADQ